MIEASVTSHTAIRHLLDVASELREAVTLDELRCAAVVRLAGWAGGSLATYSEIDFRSGVSSVLVGPIETSTRAPFWMERRDAAETPRASARYLRTVRKPRVFAISDFTSFRSFEGTPLYRDGMSLAGLKDAVLLPMPRASATATAYAVASPHWRCPELDREMLGIAQRQLHHAERTVGERETARSIVRGLEQAAEGHGESVILIGGDDEIVFVSAAAHRWLRSISAPHSSQRLSDGLAAWLGHRRAHGFTPPARHRVDGRDGPLMVTHLASGTDSLDVLIIAPSPEPQGNVRDSLPLTARERAVLARVAEGDTDAQIAAHLEISVKTVGKHLERIYRKLGVHGRTAAARRFDRSS
jgi:DNA-binding CsgD family transcriptional regulator